MVNPDGRCYVFDDRGSGYARGEGVSTIILKRLDDALADGDNIHAVIANSGSNQDGKTVGISVPSGIAQAALMKSVYSRAGLDPADTHYVEAHGTLVLTLSVLAEASFCTGKPRLTSCL
jgi:acyl transferase domain-containing protein